MCIVFAYLVLVLSLLLYLSHFYLLQSDMYHKKYSYAGEVEILVDSLAGRKPHHILARHMVGLEAYSRLPYGN